MARSSREVEQPNGTPAAEPEGPRRASLAQERSRRTRRDLVRAAVELWTERGFERGIEETTVEEIARAAGVTKGTFYFHFAHKEDILVEMGAGAALGMIDEAERGAAASLPMDDVLDAMLTALHRRVERVPRVAVRRSLSHQLSRRSPVGDHAASQPGGFRHAFECMLRHGLARGDLPAGIDADDLARVLHVLTTDALQQWSSDDTSSLGELLRARADLAIAGAIALAETPASGRRAPSAR